MLELKPIWISYYDVTRYAHVQGRVCPAWVGNAFGQTCQQRVYCRMYIKTETGPLAGHIPGLQSIHCATHNTTHTLSVRTCLCAFCPKYAFSTTAITITGVRRVEFGALILQPIQVGYKFRSDTPAKTIAFCTSDIVISTSTFFAVVW